MKTYIKYIELAFEIKELKTLKMLIQSKWKRLLKMKKDIVNRIKKAFP